jgi:hypothetical protein
MARLLAIRILRLTSNRNVKRLEVCIDHERTCLASCAFAIDELTSANQSKLSSRGSPRWSAVLAGRARSRVRRGGSFPSYQMSLRRLRPRVPLGVGVASDAEIRQLSNLLLYGPVTCLSGAGISTESGLPDYRSPGVPERRPFSTKNLCPRRPCEGDTGSFDRL